MNFTEVKEAHNLKSTLKTFIFILWNKIRKVDGEYPREQVMKGTMPAIVLKRRVPKIKGYTSLQDLAISRKHYMKEGLLAGWELIMIEGSLYVSNHILNPTPKNAPEFTFQEISSMIKIPVEQVVARVLAYNIMTVDNNGLTRAGFADFLTTTSIATDIDFLNNYEEYLKTPDNFELINHGGLLSIRRKIIQFTFEDGLKRLVEKGILTESLREFLLKSI